MKYMPIDSEYIHYGTNFFDKTAFIHVRNDWVKPVGGFWASLVNDEYGWINWSAESDYPIIADKWIKFILNSDRILCLTSYDELLNLPHINRQDELDKYLVDDDLKHHYLDFEQLARNYDGMYVEITNDHRFEWGLQLWDCNSLLLFNPNVLQVTEVSK